MTYVLLGNSAPLNNDGSPATTADDEPLGSTMTEFTLRQDWDDVEVCELARSTANDPIVNEIADLDIPVRCTIGVLEVRDAWQYHSAPGDAPEWIESDDDELADALVAWFGRAHDVQVGRPAGWEDGLTLQVQAGLHPPLAGADPLLDEFFEPERSWREFRLLTSVGRDALHNQHLNATQPARFDYMAVSANATAASSASTTLPGEIATAGGGLLRGTATHAHTVGTNTSTLTRTVTANGSDALPVTLAKIGLLNAASVGTLGYETLLAATATLTISGDNAAITWTGTIG